MKYTVAMASVALLGMILTGFAAAGREIHVSCSGEEQGDGSVLKPYRTISAAAREAYPGDVVTVHAGVYREHVDPPRGGESELKRIVYQAAPGETVEVKGSEVVKGWTRVQEGVWKVTLPNTFFGGLNPYSDLIRGDWFDPKGREHHTGAVYLDGEWLSEAAQLEEVMAPRGTLPLWLTQSRSSYLLNVAWLRPQGAVEGAPRVPAASLVAKNGTQNAPCSEGGECIGYILGGCWVKYAGVDFGEKSEVIEIRAASATDGGLVEVRLDGPEGQVLGSCAVPGTGGWQSWSSYRIPIAPTSGVKALCLLFKGRQEEQSVQDARLWYGKVDGKETTIWAQFGDADPNEHVAEINVRRAVFYPTKPGMNYITVRGFGLRQAATQWAPPTAEQVGLVGTHWSKGWVIENNTISHSVCCGVALGKHGDEFDNTSANTAEGYVKTIERGVARGWSKENIGHHVVRNNTISHCEQTGIVGSLGGVFSSITGNTIHDIHVRQYFSGAEMAGIKLHAAIDTEIRGNRIYRSCRGIWLDWMAQGARVSGNLFHDNIDQDLFVEVNHGPFVVDNNVFLSSRTLLSVSQGGAYVHNLIAGAIHEFTYDARLTPFHKAHSTEVAGMHDNPSGDDRFFNNLFVGKADLSVYDKAKLPVLAAGNLYLGGAKPCVVESDAVVRSEGASSPKLVEKTDGVYLEFVLSKEWLGERARRLVTTELLGKAAIPGLPYEQADGTPLRIGTDFRGTKRDESGPVPGPFEIAEPGSGLVSVKVW